MNTSSLLSFERDLNDTLAAIDQCVQSRQHMPAKILIYSLIDSIAWASSAPATNTTRQRFESWTNRWLIPQLQALGIAITATDLYAARCAVLHTMTPDSDLSRSGKAKRMAYAWGTGSAEFLNNFFQENGISDCVAVHYDDLVQSVKVSISSFFAEVERDIDLQAVFKAAADNHYSYVNIPVQESSDG